MRARRACVEVLVAVLAISVSKTSRAAALPAEGEGSAPARPSDELPETARPSDERPGYFQLQIHTLVGTGLRFNNPYRLATPLGSTAESVSRTAAYLDLGTALILGSPSGFQHGPQLRASLALEGVRQTVLTPSYLLYRRRRSLAAFARIGVPIVVSPDASWGGEVAVGGAWFFRGGLGVVAELVGGVFYGAGTAERSVPAYPLLSGALGLVVAYEALP